MSQIIASTYEIIKRLGAGGGGNVYLAQHLRLKKKVVLKIDKRKMELAAPIRAMGYANVPVKLHNEVSAKIRVHISEQ